MDNAEFSKNLLENFDSQLQDFYCEVIHREIGNFENRNVFAIRKALREVVNAYKKGTVQSNASSILFDTPEKRCAYVLKHSACFGSAVAKHFLKILRNDLHAGLVLSIRKRLINLCCLGGGPGTDAVAIAKVLSAMDIPWRRERLHLKVSIVDLSGEWWPMAKTVFRTLNETAWIFDPEWTEVSLELFETDLTAEPWGEPVKRAIARADVITMVYFVSAVNGSPAQGKCVFMLKNVMDVIKPNSLLFFLDSSKELHYDAVHSAASQNRQFREVYGPFVQEFHTLSRASIRKFLDLYLEHFNALLCLTDCFITTAGWTKLDCNGTAVGNKMAAPDRQEAPVGHSDRRWKKRARFNTRRQELFRQRVEGLLLSQLKMDFRTDDLLCDLEDRFWELYYDCCLPCGLETLYASKSKQRRIVIS